MTLNRSLQTYTPNTVGGRFLSSILPIIPFCPWLIQSSALSLCEAAPPSKRNALPLAISLPTRVVLHAAPGSRKGRPCPTDH